MAQLHLAIIREEMLETNGECPAGFEIGDWSDDSGECCCDPSNQPIEEPEDGEEPIEIPSGGYGDGEEPIEIPFGDGEEPIEIGGYGGGEEPVLIPSGDGEEPVEVPQGDGEEPVEIGYGGPGDGEEPVVIGRNQLPSLVMDMDTVMVRSPWRSQLASLVSSQWKLLGTGKAAGSQSMWR